MADNLNTGTPTASTSVQLLYDARVAGIVAPTHTPQRAIQTYVDTVTGRVWEWWGNAWH
jgi:hypothetical protein